MSLSIAGPLNGMLLARTSTRFVSSLGVCLMTVSLVAFAYVPVDYMYLAYGVGYGMYISKSCIYPVDALGMAMGNRYYCLQSLVGKYEGVCSPFSRT